jgi:hypothetical protein
MSGCTTVRVKPVKMSENKIKRISIIENPKVKVEDMLSIIENKLKEHHITYEVIQEGDTANHEYLLTYTALRSWDIKPYVAFADIEIKKNTNNKQEIIGTAVYKAGGDFTKFKSTKSKIDPVMDELLIEFKKQK